MIAWKGLMRWRGRCTSVGCNRSWRQICACEHDVDAQNEDEVHCDAWWQRFKGHGVHQSATPRSSKRLAWN